MNILYKRAVDRYLGGALCRLLSLMPQKKHNPPPQPPQKILIVLLSEMGSLVLAYPMIKYLMDRYPDSKLNILVFEQNREVVELLDAIKGENTLTIRDDSFAHFFFDSIKIIRKLRRIQLDAVIDCELFSRASSLLSYLSGALIRSGFHPYTQEGLYRGNFINRPVLYNPYLHISQQFLNLAYALEINTVPNVKHTISSNLLHVPRKQISDVEINAYSIKLQKYFPRLEERRLVLIYPSGGLLPIRAWPLDNYCVLSKALIDEGLLVGIIGLHQDGLFAEKIIEFAGNDYCIDLTGYTSTLKELLVLIRQADLLVTNDGGPAQFGALLEIPSIVFFGPESPQLYSPLSSSAYCFYQQLSCSPCLTAYNHRNSPCDGDNQCLKRITVDEVLDKARQMLDDPGIIC